MELDSLPFGIDFVIEQDLVPQGIKKYPNNQGYNINCPFCASKGLKPDKKHKMSVNIYKNVVNCIRCNTGYGMLDLHRELTSNGLSRKDAIQDLKKRWEGLPSDVQVKLVNVKDNLEKERAKKLEPAPIEIRDNVYRKFLDQLTLSKKHHDDLIKRGLTEEEIIAGGYKSVPVVGLKTFVSNSITPETKEQLIKHRNWGIPGFYNVRTDKPTTDLFKDNGYFIPIYNEFKLISGMQIRYDKLDDDASVYKKEHYAKYKWFTSTSNGNFEGCSCSGIENIHYAGDWFKTPRVVMLTEGVLKSDIASCLNKRLTGKKENTPIIGLVGVNNCSQLGFELMKLKNYGLEKVVVCVDMDYRTKPQVKQALDNIKKIIKDAGLESQTFDWGDENQKGIDDYLLSLSLKKGK